MLDQDLVVHELFHSAQWSYRNLWGSPSCSGFINAYTGAYQVDGWFHESNAVWMEFSQVEQGRHAGAPGGYWGNLNEYFGGTAQGLQGWVGLLTGSQLRAYAEAIFSRYLELTQGGSNAIKTIWENAGDPGTRITYAINSAVGGNLSSVFADFAAANYTRDVYPYSYKWATQITVKREHDHTNLSLPGNTRAPGRAEVASLGAEYVRVTNFVAPAGTKLNLDLKVTANSLLIPEGVSLVLLKRRVGVTSWELPEKLSLVYVPEVDELWSRRTMIDDVSEYEEIVLVLSNGMWRSESDFVKFWYTLELVGEDIPPDVKLLGRKSNRGDRCNQLLRVSVEAVDHESGLGHITAWDVTNAWSSPVQLLDQALSNPPDEVFSAPLLTLSVGESRLVSVEVTDQVGNVATSKRLFYLPSPGCDGPDDNFSAASMQLPVFSLPSGARATPKVAVLNNGFPDETAAFLAWAGEPVDLVNDDFDPVATLSDFSVLVIPSGGLYGLSDLPSFRARLEEYARLGGVIVAFDQQHGIEYSALPGSELSGYGWSEDTSCFTNAFYLATSHSILSGFNKPRLNVQADGYFTSWPADATILLRRSANGQPGAALYPFGEGWVFATTTPASWCVISSRGRFSPLVGGSQRGVCQHSMPAKPSRCPSPSPTRAL
ncbi:MAG TPA: hypothetical protein VIK33_07635 [Anaerolineae bacterium]